jgi:RNA polymerase sigma-70 factor (ECF subfamily)
METTPVSLLDKLKRSRDPRAWQRLVELITPLLFAWARRVGLQDADAADLVQETFLLIHDKIPHFNHSPQGSFRGWLRTVLLNRWRELARRRKLPLQHADLNEHAEPTDSSEFEVREFHVYLVHRSLEMLRGEFSASTLTAFRLHVLEGKSCREVAAQLGLSINAVSLAKFRISKRLRQELKGISE